MTRNNPVRYPGGKGRKSIVNQILALYPNGELNDKRIVEPFCGGCGFSLELLERGIASSALLNDGDPRIIAMWRSIAYHTDDMIKLINNNDITMNLYKKSKQVANNNNADELERGFATYILNRCCRSGYIDGGVIGGNSQNGAYKLDSRFNKPTLTKSIRYIGMLARIGTIRFTRGYDAIDFITNKNISIDDQICFDDSDFLYIDPPYINKGKACYKRSVQHEQLANVLNAGIVPEWLLSYDDCPEVHSLYDGYGYRFAPLFINYSNNDTTRGKTCEILIKKQ